MDNISQEVSRNIAALLTQKNRSKKSVAEEAGIPITTLGRKLNGGGDFTIAEIARIADALAVNPLRIFPRSFVATDAA